MQLTISPPSGANKNDVSTLWGPDYFRESLAIGGDFRASTRFAVPLSRADKWRDYLGWTVEERWGGVLAFSGRIHGVLVDVAGSVSATSLDNVRNAVRAKYTELTTDTEESEELISNGGFETLDPLGEYTFEGWGELGTDGLVAQVSAIKHSGSYSVRVTAGASTNKQVGSSYRVRPGKNYDLVFWTRGDGTYAGRYEIFNNNTNTNLVSLTSTGVTGTTWTEITVNFTIPDGCHSISLRLRCPAVNGGVAYYDDVSLRAYEKASFTTDWYTDEASIARYGRFERELSPRIVTDEAGAVALATAVLARNAWPENEPQRLADSSPTHATVTITIKGHIQELNYQHLDDTSTDLVDADDAVLTTLSAATTSITAGDIRANSAVQISEESSGERIWQRLKEIAEFGDGTEQYLIGCYAGTRLDYKPIDANTISYTAEMTDDGKLRYYDVSNREIPGAVMKPGLIVWRRDLSPGVPRRTPYTDDIRATLIGSISIRRGQVSISALAMNETAFLHSLVNSISKGA